jgi:hypothetical protein
MDGLRISTPLRLPERGAWELRGKIGSILHNAVTDEVSYCGHALPSVAYGYVYKDETPQYWG